MWKRTKTVESSDDEKYQEKLRIVVQKEIKRNWKITGEKK